MIEIFDYNSLNQKHNLYVLGNIYFFGFYDSYRLSIISEVQMDFPDKYIIQDIDKGIHYYSLAANQNSLEAQIRLGDIYSVRKYVPRDINKAIHYYSLAANQNNSYASFQLVNIYREGIYIQPDINKEIHYFILASYDPDYSIEYKLKSIFKNEKSYLYKNKFSINFKKLSKEYEIMRNDIKSNTIRRLHSDFKFSHYKFPNTDDDHILFIYKAKLFFYLKNFKFIVFDIKHSRSTEKSSYSQIVEVIICVEKNCIIVENIHIATIKEIIKKLKYKNLKIINVSSALKENGESKEDIFLKEEIENFESCFNDEIKNNKFVEMTISSLITYSVHRFFCPTRYFSDQFFCPTNYFRDKINDIFYSSDKSLKKIVRGIVKQNKYNEHHIIEKCDFKEKDFIVLRNITCKKESSISLVICRYSLHIFAMKIIKHKTKEIEHEINFCSKYSHRSFTPFYGFVKSENNDIVGFIYKYMSNNSLSSYLSSEEADDIFIMTTILRIYSGIKYLQSKSLIHRDLKPSNILLDQDFIPYISDFETIRSIKDESTPMTNDLGSSRYTSPEQDDGKELTYATDIYSFGLIIYFLYERENMFDTNLTSIFDKKRNYDIRSIQKSSTKMNDLYKKCVKFEHTARPTINEIKTIITDEIESFCYLDQFFQSIRKTDIFQLALQFMYENILISIENTRKLDKHFKSLMFKRDYLKAKKYYGLSAEQNNSDALNIIGDIYYYGKGFKRNYLKAKKYYELSAKQNNSTAFIYLGYLYQYGEGVKQDYLKAKEYYELSAKQNNSTAFIYLGYLYQYGLGVEQDYLKAKKYYELSAKQNNSTAFIYLGYLYQYGEGVKQDYLKAKEYYELSAEQNNSTAFIYLGYLYQYGEGVKQDYLKAKEYYELSAEQNNSTAFIYLGYLYQYGEGVEQDYLKAKEYYELSAEQNNSDAFNNLGHLYQYGLGVEQDYLKAKEYYELSAKQNNSTAFYKLGHLYQYGLGVDKDYLKAKEYYELSAKQNNSDAFNNLGHLYYYGEGVEQDFLKAKEYYELSAEQNNSTAFNNLGHLYYYGEGVEQDYLKAKEYYELSAKQNNSTAFIYLGYLYQYGLGVDKDYLKAKEYYVLSAKQNNSTEFYKLGHLYQYGLGVDKDYLKAKEYYELSAKQNNSTAFYKLGHLYQYGLGVDKDYLKAKEYYVLSAKQNNSTAFYKLGHLYQYGLGVDKDYLKAKEYYELSAKQNNSTAFNKLGHLYQYGLGVAKDFLRAKIYYELSVKEGDSFAPYALGILFHYGVDKNYMKVKKYYEMAVKKGNYLAYKALGDMYFNGEGVEKDYIQAKKLYEMAAGINNFDALFKLGDIYFNGYGVERDYHKAMKYFELSAEQNNPDALFFLGNFYSSNEFCDRKISKSIENYLKCIQIENRYFIIHYSKEKKKTRTFRNNRYRHRAKNDLGLIYLLDIKDFKKANEYIKESAFSEYPFGQNNFGLINEIYFSEIGNAEYLYKRSSNHCFSLAEYNLGYLKEKAGREEESIEYYIKASEYEDEPLIYRDIEHRDIRLTISKTFVICFTNLKLFEYYFKKGNSNKSRKYFIKSFSKLKIKDEEEGEEFSYQFELQFDHNDVQKSISYLKTFIFNFPSFNLFNQPSLKTALRYLKIKNENDKKKKHHKRSKKSKRKTESIKKLSIQRASKDENYYQKMKLSSMNENEGNEDKEEEEIGGCVNEGVTIFSDPEKFIDFVYKNEQHKKIFIEAIKDIIQCMKEILYTPPYVILFGRLHIRKQKDCFKEISELFPHRKEINELFYEGLDIEEFQYHKT